MHHETNWRGWTVVFSALGINLILGILYSWSVIQMALVNQWGWSHTEASLPYTISVAVFAVVMIFAGRAQDRFGPGPVAMLGGILLGGGLIVSSLSTDPAVITLAFGIAGGMGIGLGFSAGTPCAIKWFEPGRKGLIAGIVVSGVGLSPVYIAPLANSLLRTRGIENTFLYLGLLALAGITLLSLLLRNPPSRYTSDGSIPAPSPPGETDFTWREMLKTRSFYLLWLSFLLSSAAGLMLIVHLAGIALLQAGWQAGYILIVILSIFNAAGRLTGGMLSDRAGRTRALVIVFLVQAVNMLLFAFYRNIPALIAGSAIAGLAYGSVFAIFPAATADMFGLRNFGVNYGLVFTGWGIAGVTGPVLGAVAVDSGGTYTVSYLISVLMLGAGLLVARNLSPPGK